MQFTQSVSYPGTVDEVVAMYLTPAYLERRFGQFVVEGSSTVSVEGQRVSFAGTVRPEAPSRVIARSVVALSDGLQIQWLCSTTPGSAADRRLDATMVSEMRLFVDGLREQWRIGADARG